MKVLSFLVINVITGQQTRVLYINIQKQYMKVSSFLVINALTWQPEKEVYLDILNQFIVIDFKVSNFLLLWSR